jgi:tetratricopeptide (TPR) repeat protein
MRDGVLYLDGLLRPADQAVAYVVAFVRSDRDRAAVLRLGSPGPIKVWVNGAAVFTHDVVRPAALDQDAVGVRLGRGWNRILIKTVVSDGRGACSRASPTRRGAPLGLRDDARRAAARAAALARRASQPAPQGRHAGRVARTAGAPAGPRGRRGVGRSRAPARLDDAARPRRPGRVRGVRDGVQAAAPPRPAPALRLAAADATDDDDERRRMLEQALDAQPPPPWRALLLARLGVNARAARRDAKALEAWREALAIDPACWAASTAIAQEEADAGLPLTAVARLEALAPPAGSCSGCGGRPYACTTPRTAARGGPRAGRLARDRRRDTDLMHQLSIRARRRGDGEEARTRLSAVVALRPDVPSLEIELARLLEGAGEAQRARAALQALAARLPDEPAAQVALGKLLHRLGKGDEAMAPLRTALALRPQDPELKRYIDRLAAGEGGDGLPDELARRFAEDAVAMLPPARQAVADPTGSGAVVLLDRRVVRVHRNGLSRTFASASSRC